MSRKSGWMGLVLVGMLAMAVGAQEKAEKAKPITFDVVNGSMKLVAPENWKRVEPKFPQMIKHEFRAPADAKESDQARITVMPATGSIEQNIKRWKDQFDGLKEEDASVEVKEIAEQTVHFVDLKGTFKDSMGGGPFAGGKVEKRPNYRMLGVIIESKNEDPTFIKMTGPGAVVEKLVDDWKKMMEQLEAAK